MISGFGREVDENCAFLGHYATISGNFLPMVVQNYHCLLRNDPEERSSEASFCREMIAVCSDIHVQRINVLCRQNVNP